MSEEPGKIEVVVNDYSALNKGVEEVARRSTLATRLLSAQVWLERVKVLFWAALILGLLITLIGVAIFIARGDLDLSWGKTKETIRYIKVPDPNLSRVVEKTVIVEKPIITPINLPKEIGVQNRFTIFRTVKDTDGSNLSVVTGLVFPNSETKFPKNQYCYAANDIDVDGVFERVDLAVIKESAPKQILTINAQQSKALGISVAKSNGLHLKCRFMGSPDAAAVGRGRGNTVKKPDEIKRKVKASSGTGFAVNSDGYIITNEHVVRGCDVQGFIYANKPRRLELIAKNKKLDVAILKSSSIKIIDHLKFSSTLVTAQNVYAYGFPLLGQLSKELKVTDGIVSSLSGIKNDRSRIQVTTPIQPGNSGGPVVDERGLVVGVTVSGLVGKRVQNINFAIKKDNVLAFLSQNRVPFKISTTAINQQRPDVYENMKKAVFPIFCINKN